MSDPIADFKVALGYNNAAGLATLVLTPDTDGIVIPREIGALSGMIYGDGKPYIHLRMPDYATPDDWVALEGQFGLSLTAVSRKITIRLPDENKRTYSNFNAICKRANPGTDVTFDMFYYKRPTILVRSLAAL